MNGKKLSRLFIAAIVLAFVFSLAVPCAAEFDFGSPEDFEDYGFYGTYEVDDFYNDEEFPFEAAPGIVDRGDLYYSCTEPRLVDNADLLTSQEEKSVLKLLNDKSEEYKFDIVVVTENSIGSKSSMEYADDYFDYNGYGFGDNHDGVLLLVSMENRDYWVSTCGFGIDAITSYGGVEYVEEAFLDYLGSGDYETAFISFAEACGELVENAINGNPYDRYEDDGGNYYYGYYDDAAGYYNSYNDNIAFGGFGYFIPLIISLVVGLIIASVVVNIMKSKLKTVRKQPSASNYVVGGSMHIDRNEDRFLYANIAKVKIATEDNNHRSSGGSFHGSGGGGVHVSSSGVSHGGGGGHF